MIQLRPILMIINGLLKTYKITGLIGVSFFVLNSKMDLQAQTADPATSIRELKNGYLIVRMPAFKAKIDTLRAMVTRSSDNT